MARNRALLFTINIVVAVLLVTVYLERWSFDLSLRRGYLLAIEDIKKQLIARGLPGDLVSEGDVDGIEKVVFEKRTTTTMPEDWLEAVSFQMFRLRRIKNDMGQIALPASQGLPIGLVVPRNDLVPIAGLFLLILYSWLCFSFRQLGSIVTTLRNTFVAEDSDRPDKENAALFRKIIELHFLFRTSKRGPARFFVLALFYSSPIAMAICLLNDFISVSGAGEPFRAMLRAISSPRLILETIITVCLGFIGYQIYLADRGINVASFGKPLISNQDDD